MPEADIMLNEVIEQEVYMSQVYLPEDQIMARIERLELDGRDARRRIEHISNANDRRVLNRQLEEIKQELASLQARLR